MPLLPSMAHKSTFPASCSGIRLSLWLRSDAPSASAKPLFHCSIPCSFARFTLAFDSPSAPCPDAVLPQSSLPHSCSSAMSRRHLMRCRRGGGRSLPSRPPTSVSVGRTVKLSVDWEEPEILDPINMTARLSLHLPESPSEASGSGLRYRKRCRNSTISPASPFSPRKMVVLPIQQASNSDRGSSSSNEDGTNAKAEALVASSPTPISHVALLPPSTAQGSKQEDDELDYACRIEEESFQPPEKDDNSPTA